MVVHSRAGTADHSAFQQTRIPLFKEQFPNVEIRYEELVTRPGEIAERLAAMLEVAPDPLAATFAGAHSRSVANWRRLSAQELADIEREAGPLLAALGYS